MSPRPPDNPPQSGQATLRQLDDATSVRPDRAATRQRDRATRSATVAVDFASDPALAASWDEARITTLVEDIVRRHFAAEADYVISLHLVDDQTIRAMNAEHRANYTHTDVLSFPLNSPDESFVVPPDQPTNLGDVVVSYPRAVEQAHEYGHSVDREVAYLVAHGVLHVLGYDHEEEEDRRLMRQKEEEALAPLGFTR